MQGISKREALDLMVNAVKMNRFERAISAIAPGLALRRAQSRAALAMTGAYVGGSRTRKATQEWIISKGDADTDLLWDLPTLMQRSRDLERNDPLGHGAIQTKGINVIGPGLKYHPQFDRDVLGMGDAEAEDLEAQAKREWRLFWNTHEVDFSRICSGPELEWMGYKQCKVNGTAIVLFPRIKRAGSPYSTKIQIVEADRLRNKDFAPDTDECSSGVRKNKQTGEPVEYQIMKSHPGRLLSPQKFEWDLIPAYGEKTGLRNVLHIFRQDRPGQSTGIPDLTPVIETFKMLGSYTNSEVEAALLQSFFTVFVKLTNPDAETGSPIASNSAFGKTASRDSDDSRDIKLGKGSIVGLNPMEEIQLANPARPNANYDPFFQSIVLLAGAALGLPKELILKSFTASYSASRGAILEAWNYFLFERQWWAYRFNQAILEMFWFEAVSLGRLQAPGFFDDPLIRQAYLGSSWTGPAKGMLDELKEIEAAERRVNMTITTLEEETAGLVGGDWEAKFPQRVKENQKVKDAGLLAFNPVTKQDQPGGNVPPESGTPPQKPSQDGGSDAEQQ